MHKPWSEKQHRMLFWGIIALGVFARLWRFGKVPGGMNQDEALAAYEAWSIFTTGMDTAGYRFPVYLTAWGSGMNALETYLMIPFVALFGLKSWAVRLPQLLTALLSLPAVYGIGKRLWDRRTAYVAMLLLAVCPWHILLSRWGLESNLAPGFLLFGLLFFLRSLEDSRYILLSAVFYGLSLYAYAAVWPILPFLLLAQGIWAVRCGALRANGRLLAAVLILAMLAAPLLLFLAVNLGWIEELRGSLLSVPKLLVLRDGELSASHIPENLENLIGILWRQSDGLLWNYGGWFGLLYPISLPFTVLGVLSSLREKRAAPALLQLLAGLILGALMKVNVNRINLLFPPLILFTARGLVWFGGLFRIRLLPVLLACYMVLFTAFQVYYFTDYRQQIGTLFGAGMGEAVSACADAETVILSREIYYPQLLFYTRMPAEEFRQSVQYRYYPAAYLSAASIGRWHFGIDPSALDSSAYYVLSPWEDRRPFQEAGFTLTSYGVYCVAEKEGA